MRRTFERIICIGTAAAISLLAVSLLSRTASAQWYQRFSGGSVGVAAAGQFTTSLTSQTTGANAEAPPRQSTTNSPGVLLSFRAYPVSRVGIELNYQDTKLQERNLGGVTGSSIAFLSANAHEATAAYLFRLHLDRLHLWRFVPYVGVGGGFMDFAPTAAAHSLRNQWRETGLVEVSWDKQTRSRVGFRLGVRDMIYRAPNFQTPALSSSRFVSTLEPFGGVYIILHRE